MDADEALARQLQAEEDQRAAAAAAHLRGAQQGHTRLAQLIEDALRKAQGYEDELAQAVALSVMPLDRLAAAADEAVAVSAAMGEQPPLGREDGAPLRACRSCKARSVCTACHTGETLASLARLLLSAHLCACSPPPACSARSAG